jgi:hypothetical protein
MSDYPSTIYNPRAKENKSGVVFNPDKKTVLYAEDLSLIDAEIVAIETILGLDPTGEFETIGAFLQALASAIGSIPSSLLDLSDTPSSFTDKAGFKVVVNEGETGVEFVEDTPFTPDSVPMFYGIKKGGFRGLPHSIQIDSDAIYSIHDTYNEVFKSNKDTLATIGHTNLYLSTLNCITTDDDYIYLFAGNDRVYKISKTNLSSISNSYIGKGIIAAVNDENYIYGYDSYTDKIVKISKSTLSVVTDSADTLSAVGRILCQDTDYIYCATSSASGVKKIAKATLAAGTTLDSYDGTILDFDTDGTYLYFSQSGMSLVAMYLLSDFEYPYYYLNFDNDITSIFVSDGYLLVIDGTTSRAILCTTSDRNILTESPANTETSLSFGFSFPHFIYGGSTFNCLIKRPIVNFYIES